MDLQKFKEFIDKNRVGSAPPRARRAGLKERREAHRHLLQLAENEQEEALRKAALKNLGGWVTAHEERQHAGDGTVQLLSLQETAVETPAEKPAEADEA